MHVHFALSFRSLEEPPRVPMFVGGREKRPNQVQMLTSAVSEMARAMTGGAAAHSTSSAPAGSSTTSEGISPGKVANLRSSYLQQMRELHSLFESGALTQCEFQEQKIPILEQLKKLSP